MTEAKVPVADHEAIQMMAGDYLKTLTRMVAEARERKDPTIAIALSVDALGRLVSEVAHLRVASDLQGFQVAMLMDSRHKAHEPNGAAGDECQPCIAEFDRISVDAYDALAFASAAVGKQIPANPERTAS